MATLEHAISIAANAHAGQLDKGGQPYILHCLRVMLRVSTPYERMVAVLHDVVEDTSVTLGMLTQEGFPLEVVTAIDSLTKREGESRMQAAARAKANPIGLNVKLADNAENSDLTRIPNPSAKDLERNIEYLAIKNFLLMPATDLVEADLSEDQKKHLSHVFLEARAQMSCYMLRSAEVFISEQNEVEEVGRYAIRIKEDPDFFVDCVDSISSGEELAKKLGFTVVQQR